MVTVEHQIARSSGSTLSSSNVTQRYGIIFPLVISGTVTGSEKDMVDDMHHTYVKKKDKLELNTIDSN